ncbi:zinc ion binding/nucleic acid binding/hydrolase [Rhynchospora pubera]|uniref:Fanconi-associated nuclease n=1 Tax=Rhynchospora pubera TaxID=906938 RepID=A0AAV8D6X1_9POAL|nr:zinc ion binding/nucleic acid binding/hydrolase [Rhynchospora pubera]
MLRGRESLIRLVGKRRRAISPAVAQLLNQNPSSSSAASTSGSKSVIGKDLAGAEVTNKVEEEREVGLVSCPVCGASIRGTDYNVNSHLDICLKRGTKRKLSQQTLLQFMSPPSCKRGGNGIGVNSLDMDLVNADPPTNECILYTSSCASSLEENHEDLISVDECSSPRNSETRDAPVLPESSFEGNSSTVLDTYIVGRKFCDNVELEQDTQIILTRDTQNVKDSNAIKVTSTRLEMLGYLPRELSKCLAPLLDYNCIDCEGSVASLPLNPQDAVPIKLSCHKKDYSEHGTNSAIQKDFSSLWKTVLVEVERGKQHPPNVPRYQQNFNLLIEDVMRNHSHLFTDKEMLFIGSFKSLSDAAQRLFIRLYTRKGPWFRMSKISYPEITDPPTAAEELKEAGYLYLLQPRDNMKVQECDMENILGLLTVAELRETLKTELLKERINCTCRKELLKCLLSAYESGNCRNLQKRITERMGTCVRIAHFADELLWRVQRLFFLNGEQDLSAFLLVDIGVTKYPNYVCDASHRIFSDRCHLLEYEEAIQVAQVMDESLDKNNMKMVERCIEISENYICSAPMEETSLISACVFKPRFFSCFTAWWVYTKVLTLGVSVYERERRYEDAIRILKSLLQRTRDSRRGYWTLRLSVNLEHMGYFNESLLVAEEGIGDPWVRAGSKMALQRRVLRLGKPPRRWKLPSFAESVRQNIPEVNIVGRPVNGGVGEKNLFYGYNGELCGVEELALQYFAEEGGGWHGVHSESGIWMTIFGLLMWDVIFSDVPNAFCSKFQTGPLDLDTDDFYESRKDLIESQLNKIQGGMAEEILITCWELHYGELCRGVNWERHSLSDLRAAVFCMKARSLASICHHLALDYRSWSSGMPDLLLWRFYANSTCGEVKLVEVKGPRDRLSEQQRAWILVLMDCGFNAEVCKVSPAPKAQD